MCMNESKKKGFTLVEITIVVVLIGILVAIIIPIYRTAVVRAREAVLKENLYQVRDAIRKYYYDKKKYPSALDDLVTGKYLARVPLDPIAKAKDWELLHFEPDDMEDYDPEIAEGIIDVKTTARGISLDGSNYEDW
ncbi:MAG: prepilin-type N-terminal cleavage/methylation domain-containing protein [bacterium]|nr:prepilin-type N-terminal cleavage/methylation domain-containing protein [bacterium]